MSENTGDKFKELFDIPLSKQGYESNPDLKTVFDVASKTIGFYIAPLKAEPSEPEITEEENKAISEHEKIRNSRKPYVLKPEEREIVKELLNTDDEGLDELEIYILCDGEICVRTPLYTWTSLCGREWWFDLKNKTHYLVSMS